MCLVAAKSSSATWVSTVRAAWDSLCSQKPLAKVFTLPIQLYGNIGAHDPWLRFKFNITSKETQLNASCESKPHINKNTVQWERSRSSVSGEKSHDLSDME